MFSCLASSSYQNNHMSLSNYITKSIGLDVTMPNQVCEQCKNNNVNGDVHLPYQRK
jgi:hypothetical protein